jgi:hypothetical protein
MSGQVQELQVPGTPEGGTLARVTVLPYCPGGSSHGKKKIVARTAGDAAEERSVPSSCPHNPRNLWQIFNGIEQNEKMKSCGCAKVLVLGLHAVHWQDPRALRPPVYARDCSKVRYRGKSIFKLLMVSVLFHCADGTWLIECVDTTGVQK